MNLIQDSVQGQPGWIQVFDMRSWNPNDPIKSSKTPGDDCMRLPMTPIGPIAPQKIVGVITW